MKNGELLASESATRFKFNYRGLNLYVIIEWRKIHILTENSDKFKTLAGLSLVESMANKLLDSGYDLEEVSGLCFESSYNKGDLPDILNQAILMFLDGRNRKINGGMS